MACGQTAQPLRGKGIGGRLIVQMANELAAKGEHPVFLCSPERVHFYTGLALKSWGNMQDMNKLLQSKPDGFASSLNEGAFGRTEKLSA